MQSRILWVPKRFSTTFWGWCKNNPLRMHEFARKLCVYILLIIKLMGKVYFVTKNWDEDKFRSADALWHHSYVSWRLCFFDLLFSNCIVCWPSHFKDSLARCVNFILRKKRNIWHSMAEETVDKVMVDHHYFNNMTVTDSCTTTPSTMHSVTVIFSILVAITGITGNLTTVIVILMSRQLRNRYIF